MGELFTFNIYLNAVVDARLDDTYSNTNIELYLIDNRTSDLDFKQHLFTYYWRFLFQFLFSLHLFKK